MGGSEKKKGWAARETKREYAWGGWGRVQEHAVKVAWHGRASAAAAATMDGWRLLSCSVVLYFRDTGLLSPLSQETLDQWFSCDRLSATPTWATAMGPPCKM